MIETPIFPDSVELGLIPLSRLEEIEWDLWALLQEEYFEEQHNRELEMLQRDWYLSGNQDHS